MAKRRKPDASEDEALAQLERFFSTFTDVIHACKNANSGTPSWLIRIKPGTVFRGTKEGETCISHRDLLKDAFKEKARWTYDNYTLYSSFPGVASITILCDTIEPLRDFLRTQAWRTLALKGVGISIETVQHASMEKRIESLYMDVSLLENILKEQCAAARPAVVDVHEQEDGQEPYSEKNCLGEQYTAPRPAPQGVFLPLDKAMALARSIEEIRSVLEWVEERYLSKGVAQ